MIWFWILAGLLTVAALVALLVPLVRGRAEGSDRSDAVIAVFRRQLADIDIEVAQGRLAADQASAARAEITRRMLAAADRDSTELSVPAQSGAEMPWRLGAAVGIAGLLPAAALAIYVAVGAPAAIDRPGTAAVAAGTQEPSSVAAAVEQLKARLQREPNHLEGWVLLGRTFTSLGRFDEARDAYQKAVALAPNEPRLHAELGEVLVVAAQGVVSAEAEAEFAKSGDDPRARFYGAEAALQRGDTEAAKNALRKLLADAPADAPWRSVVAERLAEIAPGQDKLGTDAPAASAPRAGPTPQDMAAAQAMTPEQRQAMIRGMVERLAARLEQNPDDREGWMRLAHAYDVLGDTNKAQAARARAASASPVPAAPIASPAK